MDSIDLKLLEQLFKSARTSVKDLAKSVFLSSPATTARIEKLENRSIIKGYYADIDLEVLGFCCIAFVNFKAKGSLPDNFEDFVIKNHNILECFSVAGEYTHIMKVAFKTPKDLYGFVTNIERFGKTEVSILMENKKHKGLVDIEKLISSNNAGY